MLRFANTEFLWGLLAIPLLLFIFLRVNWWKRKAIASLGNKEMVLQMMPQVSFSRPWIKFIFFILAYSLVIVGIADPQLG
ncbi:MAG: hypothetical protein JWQ57_1206, partial [Mucilaginibacter sp.]|nr:hypothetical protein [Mucilaginibacter sp.]